MLDVMLSGRFEVTRTEEEHVFIDRNGQLFGYVLEWLRDRKVELGGLDAATLRRIQREFAFFGLDLGGVDERRCAVVVAGEHSEGARRTNGRLWRH